MHTIMSIAARLALIRSTYRCSQNTNLVPELAKTWVSCSASKRVVHRQRRRPDVLRGDLQRIELDPIRHHQRHRVAATDTERGEPGGHLAHPGRIIAPPQRLRVADSSQCHRIRPDPCAALKSLRGVAGRSAAVIGELLDRSCIRTTGRG